MNETVIKVKVLSHGLGLEIPAYATCGSAGIHIRAAVEQTMTVKPGERVLVPTGMAFAITKGYEVQVRPRSGLAIKHGITALNSPGTIDSDYRGEVKIILINHSNQDFIINRGDRIAQLVIAPVTHGILQVVDELDTTPRDAGGFGHTGRS